MANEAGLPSIGALRVWHIPQIPGKPFHVDVASVEEGVKVMGILANYDQFQLDNNIKGDYASTNGLELFDVDNGEGHPGWVAWYYESDELYFDDPHEYVNHLYHMEQAAAKAKAAEEHF